ncbi:MAG TPA: bacteriohopanetetrol glucosamine biosynthesis glycosyltransferase HpnI [Candidatus Baltobacteraceae bacterium]|nr:bacteriohopanetetrol glucosamine biosynthesis glycosyltransferase HpnI [Candidatus Baltobacteraceae bacterium]
MPDSPLRLIALATGAAAIAGVAYTALAIARVRRFRNDARAAKPHATMSASVLKPLYGDEPNLFENLASFCDQAYPEYQVIFGAADPADPAIAIARAVAARFPDRDIEIVAGRAHAAGNPKIGNLLGMIDRARHPLVVIADSDICAGREYLRAVAGCFTGPEIGAATCIYGGVPRASLASHLGAMQVNDQFAPSVMVATALEPLTYCFGATMAVRRDVLERIGGLNAIADHLADDYLLGRLIADAGYRVALVPYAVQTTIADDTLAALWRHELRWARAIAGRRRAGYAGSVVTYGLPFAAAFALSARTPLSAAVFVLAAALRAALHYEARRTFAPRTRASAWLIPLRDLFGLAVWAGSFFGKRVLWKTGDYRLDAGGRMAPGPKEM